MAVPRHRVRPGGARRPVPGPTEPARGTNTFTFGDGRGNSVMGGTVNGDMTHSDRADTDDEPYFGRAPRDRS